MSSPALRVRILGQDYEFTGRDVVVGRDPAADVRVANPSVSRRHAVIRLDAGGWLLEDVSRSGVYVDGERVTSLRLDTVTTVRLGHPVTGDELELIPQLPHRVAAPTLQATPLAAARPLPSRPPSQSIRLPALGDLRESIAAESARRIRIGRGTDNDVVLDDLLISRHHAELIVTPERGYRIVDLKSHNGTFVDGNRVRVAVVDETSVIGLGHHEFRLVDGNLEMYEDVGRVEFQAIALSVFVGDNRTILDDVSFSLPQNCFLAIVGPSGAGKSTLMKALTGFQPADQGQVLYDGRDLYTYLEELRPRIGYVPQDDVLHPQLTVRRALEFAAELRFPPDVSAAERSQRVEEVMEELGLSHRADLQIAKLSGGQRKRTSVALELMTKPSLLFLDEPTSGLDPGFEKSAMELLRTLADGGRTVIVVTHSLQSLDLCDRVIFLAPGGSTAFYGTPRETLDYFGRGDYADVFRELEDSQEDWKGRYATSRFHDQYVGRPAALEARHPVVDAPMVRARQRSWLGQLSTLVRRQLAIIAADRALFAILVLLAPVMGLALMGALGANGLIPAVKGGQPVQNTDTMPAVFVLAFCVALMGTVDSFREIVKELPILRRERSIGLSLSAYLASKVAVLGPFVIVQGFVLTFIGTLRQGGPKQANLFQWSPLFELGFDIALTGVAAVCTGLLISSIVSSSDKAAPIMAALVAIYLMGSGATLDIRGKPVIEQVSQVMATRWGTSAAASSVDVHTLTRNTCHSPPDVTCDRPWKHDRKTWLTDLAGLGAVSAAGILGAAYFLHRRDPKPKKRKR